MRRASLVLLAVTLAGCGATAASTTSSSQQTSTSPISTGVVSMVLSDWPAIDPATDQTSADRTAAGAQGGEDVDWFVYTGLTTYSHKGSGAKLIPGLAESMPMVLGNENTYVATLRSKLVFSNGQPVKAADFLWTVERDLRIHESPAAAQLAELVVGAKRYEDGAARTVTGITVDDATRTIVIRLTAPDRSFDRLLAVPALGLVPMNTPARPASVVPPAGAGPYELTNVVPKSSFSIVENPQWAGLAIPGIPAAKVNVNVKIDPNARSAALAVLGNQTDVFDPAAAVPADVHATIETEAAHRFAQHGGATAFTSDRIEFGALRFSRRYGLDLTSLELG
jgi:peptide/nickel transport system substrate-binding protein